MPFGRFQQLPNSDEDVGILMIRTTFKYKIENK